LRLNKLKFSHAITPIDNPLTIRAERRTIAKLQTALRTQQLGK
jgi:large subunit ribosomal protein L29